MKIQIFWSATASEVVHKEIAHNLLDPEVEGTKNY